MYKFLFICFFLFTVSADAQGLRYRNMVFTETVVHKNISYSQTPHPGIKDRYFLFDLYEPKSDTTMKRPLIIWLHGGGFKFGSKQAPGIQLWCETFAQRGYVSVGLNYERSKKNPLFNFIELKKACYNAVQDVAEAIAFFKKNHELYRIDTNRIILAGNSAGGMIALQSVYSSEAELAASAQMSGNNYALVHNPSKIAGVINFWGGIYDLNWLKNARVPIFSAYGSKDKLVATDSKNASLYGSVSIHKRATEFNIPNDIKVYEGYAHELQKRFNPVFPPGAGTKQRWRDAGQNAADFLYNQLFHGK